MADTDSDKRSLSTFRMHLLVASLTTTLAFVAVIALSLFLPLAAHLDREEISSAVSSGIAEHFLYLHSAFWPVALCSIIGCIASALLLNRKLTEPLARFVACFKQLGLGEIPQAIIIRNTDYMSEEATSLNEMLACLRERERERVDSANELDQIVDQLLTHCAGDAKAEDLVAKLCNLKGLG
jgi:methyl-accepting chemotaxis protein